MRTIGDGGVPVPTCGNSHANTINTTKIIRRDASVNLGASYVFVFLFMHLMATKKINAGKSNDAVRITLTAYR
jgi:hypothetical protein